MRHWPFDIMGRRLTTACPLPPHLVFLLVAAVGRGRGVVEHEGVDELALPVHRVLDRVARRQLPQGANNTWGLLVAANTQRQARRYAIVPRDPDGDV